MVLLLFFLIIEQELILYFFSETKTGFDVEETSLDGRDDIEDLMLQQLMSQTYCPLSHPMVLISGFT